MKTGLAVCLLLVGLLFSVGCASRESSAPVAVKNHAYKHMVQATVTADQKMLMNGKVRSVSEIPQMLSEEEAGEHITILVMPESLITRETVVDLVRELVANDYIVEIRNDSKYADVPIPRRS